MYSLAETKLFMSQECSIDIGKRLVVSQMVLSTTQMSARVQAMTLLHHAAYEASKVWEIKYGRTLANNNEVTIEQAQIIPALTCMQQSTRLCGCA